MKQRITAGRDPRCGPVLIASLVIATRGPIVALGTAIWLLPEPAAEQASPPRRRIIARSRREPGTPLGLPVARGGRLFRHLCLTTRGGAAEDDFGVLHAVCLDQVIENGSIRRRNAHAAMRDGIP